MIFSFLLRLLAPPIHTDIHIHDNDPSDAEGESGIESTMTTLSFSFSNQPLKFLIMIHQVVFSFSFFSECLKMCPESSIPLSNLVKCPTRHPIPFLLH